jgi:hypothetical protein
MSPLFSKNSSTLIAVLIAVLSLVPIDHAAARALRELSRALSAAALAVAGSCLAQPMNSVSAPGSLRAEGLPTSRLLMGLAYPSHLQPVDKLEMVRGGSNTRRAHPKAALGGQFPGFELHISIGGSPSSVESTKSTAPLGVYRLLTAPGAAHGTTCR